MSIFFNLENIYTDYMYKKKHNFIAFVGGVGSGKTTAMKLLAKKFGFTPIKERFNENNFLPLFYKDMKKWAFHSQLFFSIQKINQLLEVSELLKKTSVVLDTSIHQDFCFLDTQKKLGFLTENEYKIYRYVYKKAEKELPRPDLLIYLKMSHGNLQKNITKRKRGYEKNIPALYIRTLSETQDLCVRKYKKDAPVLTIDVNKTDFKKNKKDREKFFKIIKKAL